MKVSLALVAGICMLAGCSDPRPGPDLGYSVSGDEIVRPLHGMTGSAERGREVFASRDQGHCVICHQVDGLDVPFQGNVGPVLSGVGNRFTPAELRLRIVDMSSLVPDTLMPSYFRLDGLNQVEAAYEGQTILNAQQIEDLVAYLASLRTD